MSAALQLCRFIQFTAAMLVFGAASFRFYALPEHGGGGLAAFDLRLARLVAAAALAALLSALALLLCHSAMMAGSPAAALDPGTVAAVLLHTRFGRVWSVHLLLALALVLSCLRAADAVRTPSLILAFGLLASLGWVGHAAVGEGPAGIARELNQSLHLLAAGMWLGGLAPLGWLLRAARRADDDALTSLAREALGQFSRMGYAAVGLVALTGMVNSLLLVGSLRALAGSSYGRLLTLKILLFTALVAVALFNRFRLAPRLTREPAALARLGRAVAVEQGLGLAILAVVSILGTWPPALR